MGWRGERDRESNIPPSPEGPGCILSSDGFYLFSVTISQLLLRRKVTNILVTFMLLLLFL